MARVEVMRVSRLCFGGLDKARRCPDRAVWTSGLPFALLLAGCGITSPQPLAVELTLSAQSASEAEPVQVVVTGTNRSGVPVEVSSYGCPQVFEVVRLGRSEVVGPESLACILIALPPTRLKPGEAITFRYEWAGLAAGWERRVLPAGEYLLRGWVQAASGDRVYSDYRSVQVGP